MDKFPFLVSINSFGRFSGITVQGWQIQSMHALYLFGRKKIHSLTHSNEK